jgi:cyclic beta-1,2-glucan synthetase
MATIDLEPNSKTNIIFALGVEDNNSRFSQTKLSADNFDLELSKTREYWNNLLNTIQIETPKKEIDLLFNNHLLYQVISSRLWGRTGFFQPGGAYGYRDQLQDILSLFYAAPEMAREHIIMAASRQFSGGGVQHWWHPPENAGVRSLASDTHLWLPYTIIQYIKATNDLSILDEQVPYLAPEKNENRHQGAYFIPEISENNETLKHHLMSSIERSLFLSGRHGLPLMLSGDWNDGLDKIGKDKRGESVWLGMFLKYILEESSSLVETEISKRYLLKAKNLEDIINKTCWDGKWFLRAFWDDGETLGSYKNLEAKIDSIPQSWSVIANFDSKLSRIAVNSANKKLIDRKAQATKLFDPPFNKTPKDPGYIILYPPGVRENGGAYSHAAIWLAMANARIGNHKTSLEILDYINPVLKTQTPEGVRTYRGEPYAIAADIYTQPPFSGMAGWTWYTGSASLYYKAILEEILGVEIRGDKIHLNPRVPKDWQKFKVNITLNKASYEIIYNNKLQKKFTKTEIIIDGKKISNSYFPIEPGDHTVELNAK